MRIAKFLFLWSCLQEKIALWFLVKKKKKESYWASVLTKYIYVIVFFCL